VGGVRLLTCTRFAIIRSPAATPAGLLITSDALLSTLAVVAVPRCAIAADTGVGRAVFTTNVRANARTKANIDNLPKEYFIVSPPLAICISRFSLYRLLHCCHPFRPTPAEGYPLPLFVDETKSQMLASGQSYALSIL
jgi:hypothetical protein